MIVSVGKERRMKGYLFIRETSCKWGIGARILISQIDMITQNFKQLFIDNHAIINSFDEASFYMSHRFIKIVANP